METDQTEKEKESGKEKDKEKEERATQAQSADPAEAITKALDSLRNRAVLFLQSAFDTDLDVEVPAAPSIEDLFDTRLSSEFVAFFWFVFAFLFSVI